mgnify:CR=1 FL=1
MQIYNKIAVTQNVTAIDLVDNGYVCVKPRLVLLLDDGFTFLRV